jgi:hypothetical protein
VALLGVVALIACACTRGTATGSVSAKPADLYAALPSLADVRSLLGDYKWWPGPPSFGVRPLNVATVPIDERFTVTQAYVHVGTAETFTIDYEMWSTTSVASSRVSSVQTTLGTSGTTSPRVGDQVVYYGSQASGAAPYQTATVVRVGQVVTIIGMELKDGFPKLAQLVKIATKVVSRLGDVVSGRLHGSSLSPFDATVLPPDGLDITLLGSARILVESAMVMIAAPSIDAVAQSLRALGVNDVAFADYALNTDTRMEVRAAVFTFVTAKDANDFATLLRGTAAADQPGFYDAAQGWYIFPFAARTMTAVLICRSTADTEAASRACEAPMSRVYAAWKLNLTP